MSRIHNAILTDMI